MSALTQAALNLAIRAIGPILSLLGKPLNEWWKRRQINPASGEKLSILVAKLSGDNAANSHHHSIREAIERAMPAVSVVAWPKELPIGDGLEEDAQARATNVARKWMKSKNCDLFISGRIKSSNVVSLRFIPLNSVQPSADELIHGPQTYALPVDTMDFPTKFTDDVGAAMAACVIANIHGHISGGLAPAIESIVSQLAKIVESPTSIPDDVRTKARLIGCYAVACGIQFDYTGNDLDLRSAVEASEKASTLLDRQTFPREWSKQRSNHGIAIARLGGFLEDPGLLERAAEVMRDSLPDISNNLVSWTKVQLNLALAFSQVSRITGSSTKLLSALDLYGQLVTDELREQDSSLWATAQNHYGVALLALAEWETSDAALTRAIEAFTQSLEIWTSEFPEQRSGTLASLSLALLALGSRQNLLDWYSQAIGHLREAKSLISKKRPSRIWWSIENNLGLALSLVGEEDSGKCIRAIAILRNAKDKVPISDVELSSKISLNLARALMFLGKNDESIALLKESRELLVEISPTVASPDLKTETRNLLGLTYRYLGICSDESEYLEKSRDIFVQLSGSLDPALSPHTFFRIQQNLGLTLREMGTKDDSMLRLDQSVTAFLAASELTSKQGSPVSWAATQFQLAASYFEIAKRQSLPIHLQNAQTAIANALSVLGPLYTGTFARGARKLAEDIEEFESAGDRD